MTIVIGSKEPVSEKSNFILCCYIKLPNLLIRLCINAMFKEKRYLSVVEVFYDHVSGFPALILMKSRI